MLYTIRCSLYDVAVYVKERKAHLRDVRLQKDKPIMCHFQDRHCERDLRFSMLAKLFNGSHMEGLLRETMKTQRLHGVMSKTLVCRCNYSTSNIEFWLF